MKTEETKGKGADFGCCNPENFKEMFEKMSKCFPGHDGSADCCAMKGGMMKKMMEICCPSKATDIKENTELQKEHDEETKGFNDVRIWLPRHKYSSNQRFRFSNRYSRQTVCFWRYKQEGI